MAPSRLVDGLFQNFSCTTTKLIAASHSKTSAPLDESTITSVKISNIANDEIFVA
jgi:hypothetical protein